MSLIDMLMSKDAPKLLCDLLRKEVGNRQDLRQQLELIDQMRLDAVYTLEWLCKGLSTPTTALSELDVADALNMLDQVQNHHSDPICVSPAPILWDPFCGNQHTRSDYKSKCCVALPLFLSQNPCVPRFRCTRLVCRGFFRT